MCKPKNLRTPRRAKRNMPNNQTTGSYTPAPRGATIETAYVGREVKVYGVLESEVKAIAMFNTLSTTCFSLCAGLFFCAVGIWANAAFVEKATATGDILAHFVAPALCVLALVAAGVASLA